MYVCVWGVPVCRPEEDAGSPGAAFTGSCGSCESSEMRAGTEFTSFVRTERQDISPGPEIYILP